MNIEVDSPFNLADTKTGLMQTIDIIQAYAYRENMRGGLVFSIGIEI